jgi:hypothetical protein
MMDEFRGAAAMIEADLPRWPVGRVWPWIVLMIGVLIVVAGAVLFSPDTVVTSTSPTATWSG